MIKRNMLGAALATLVVAGCAATQKDDITTEIMEVKPTLTLDRIYQDREFTGERSTYFTWLKDGSGFTVLEKRETVLDAKDEDSEKAVLTRSAM